MRRAWSAAGLLLVGLVLALAGCGGASEPPGVSQQPQGASLRITLGTQEFPEARILGELWRQALAVNGYTVDLRKGIGPAADLDQALRDGEIDGYVAYTGTVLSVVAGEEVSGLDPEETYDQARDFYASREMVMSEMTPFRNKDAIAVTRAFAAANRLRSIGDLRNLDSFVLGARPEFETLYLGLEGLQQVYGLTNAEFAPLALGAQYAALDEGDVDVANAFTTDPQLVGGDYVLLEDPDLLFGSQNVVMVVGQDKLDRIDAEAFLAVINAVNGSLTERSIIEANAAVTAGEDDGAVATRLLRQAGLMTPLGAED